MIESGQADMIALGKSALANPDWVGKIRSGESLAEFVAERVLSPDAKLKAFEIQI